MEKFDITSSSSKRPQLRTMEINIEKKAPHLYSFMLQVPYQSAFMLGVPGRESKSISCRVKDPFDIFRSYLGRELGECQSSRPCDLSNTDLGTA